MSDIKQMCGTCRHYHKALNGCRAHAPVVFMVSVKLKDSDAPLGVLNNLGMLTLSAFPSPPQGENDLCGEYMPCNTVVLN